MSTTRREDTSTTITSSSSDDERERERERERLSALENLPDNTKRYNNIMKRHPLHNPKTSCVEEEQEQEQQQQQPQPNNSNSSSSASTTVNTTTTTTTMNTNRSEQQQQPQPNNSNSSSTSTRVNIINKNAISSYEYHMRRDIAHIKRQYCSIEGNGAHDNPTHYNRFNPYHQQHQQPTTPYDTTNSGSTTITTNTTDARPQSSGGRRGDYYNNNSNINSNTNTAKGRGENDGVVGVHNNNDNKEEVEDQQQQQRKVNRNRALSDRRVHPAPVAPAAAVLDKNNDDEGRLLRPSQSFGGRRRSSGSSSSRSRPDNQATKRKKNGMFEDTFRGAGSGCTHSPPPSPQQQTLMVNNRDDTNGTGGGGGGGSYEIIENPATDDTNFDPFPSKTPGDDDDEDDDERDSEVNEYEDIRMDNDDDDDGDDDDDHYCNNSNNAMRQHNSSSNRPPSSHNSSRSKHQRPGTASMTRCVDFKDDKQKERGEKGEESEINDHNKNNNQKSVNKNRVPAGGDGGRPPTATKRAAAHPLPHNNNNKLLEEVGSPSSSSSSNSESPPPASTASLYQSEDMNYITTRMGRISGSYYSQYYRKQQMERTDAMNAIKEQRATEMQLQQQQHYHQVGGARAVDGEIDEIDTVIHQHQQQQQQQIHTRPSTRTAYVKKTPEEEQGKDDGDDGSVIKKEQGSGRNPSSRSSRNGPGRQGKGQGSGSRPSSSNAAYSTKTERNTLLWNNFGEVVRSMILEDTSPHNNLVDHVQQKRQQRSRYGGKLDEGDKEAEVDEVEMVKVLCANGSSSNAGPTNNPNVNRKLQQLVAPPPHVTPDGASSGATGPSEAQHHAMLLRREYELSNMKQQKEQKKQQQHQHWRDFYGEWRKDRVLTGSSCGVGGAGGGEGGSPSSSTPLPRPSSRSTVTRNSSRSSSAVGTRTRPSSSSYSASASTATPTLPSIMKNNKSGSGISGSGSTGRSSSAGAASAASSREDNFVVVDIHREGGDGASGRGQGGGSSSVFPTRPSTAVSVGGSSTSSGTGSSVSSGSSVSRSMQHSRPGTGSSSSMHSAAASRPVTDSSQIASTSIQSQTTSSSAANADKQRSTPPSVGEQKAAHKTCSNCSEWMESNDKPSVHIQLRYDNEDEPDESHVTTKTKPAVKDTNTKQEQAQNADRDQGEGQEGVEKGEKEEDVPYAYLYENRSSGDTHTCTNTTGRERKERRERALQVFEVEEALKNAKREQGAMRQELVRMRDRHHWEMERMKAEEEREARMRLEAKVQQDWAERAKLVEERKQWQDDVRLKREALEEEYRAKCREIMDMHGQLLGKQEQLTEHGARLDMKALEMQFEQRMAAALEREREKVYQHLRDIRKEDEAHRQVQFRMEHEQRMQQVIVVRDQVPHQQAHQHQQHDKQQDTATLPETIPIAEAARRISEQQQQQQQQKEEQGEQQQEGEVPAPEKKTEEMLQKEAEERKQTLMSAMLLEERKTMLKDMERENREAICYEAFRELRDSALHMVLQHAPRRHKNEGQEQKEAKQKQQPEDQQTDAQQNEKEETEDVEKDGGGEKEQAVVTASSHVEPVQSLEEKQEEHEALPDKKEQDQDQDQPPASDVQNTRAVIDESPQKEEKETTDADNTKEGTTRSGESKESPDEKIENAEASKPPVPEERSESEAATIKPETSGVTATSRSSTTGSGGGDESTQTSAAEFPPPGDQQSSKSTVDTTATTTATDETDAVNSTTSSPAIPVCREETIATVEPVEPTKEGSVTVGGTDESPILVTTAPTEAEHRRNSLVANGQHSLVSNSTTATTTTSTSGEQRRASVLTVGSSYLGSAASSRNPSSVCSGRSRSPRSGRRRSTGKNSVGRSRRSQYQAILRLGGPYWVWLLSTQEWKQELTTALVSDISNYIGVSKSAVRIDRLERGSLVVDFTVFARRHRHGFYAGNAEILNGDERGGDVMAWSAHQYRPNTAGGEDAMRNPRRSVVLHGNDRGASLAQQGRPQSAVDFSATVPGGRGAGLLNMNEKKQNQSQNQNHHDNDTSWLVETTKLYASVAPNGGKGARRAGTKRLNAVTLLEARMLPESEDNNDGKEKDPLKEGGAQGGGGGGDNTSANEYDADVSGSMSLMAAKPSVISPSAVRGTTQGTGEGQGLGEGKEISSSGRIGAWVSGVEQPSSHGTPAQGQVQTLTVFPFVNKTSEQPSRESSQYDAAGKPRQEETQQPQQPTSEASTAQQQQQPQQALLVSESSGHTTTTNAATDASSSTTPIGRQGRRLSVDTSSSFASNSTGMSSPCPTISSPGLVNQTSLALKIEERRNTGTTPVVGTPAQQSTVSSNNANMDPNTNPSASDAHDDEEQAASPMSPSPALVGCETATYEPSSSPHSSHHNSDETSGSGSGSVKPDKGAEEEKQEEEAEGAKVEQEVENDQQQETKQEGDDVDDEQKKKAQVTETDDTAAGSEPSPLCPAGRTDAAGVEMEKTDESASGSKEQQPNAERGEEEASAADDDDDETEESTTKNIDTDSNSKGFASLLGGLDEKALIKIQSLHRGGAVRKQIRSSLDSEEEENGNAATTNHTVGGGMLLQRNSIVQNVPPKDMHVKIKVLECRNLINADSSFFLSKNDLSDPYVTVTYPHPTVLDPKKDLPNGGEAALLKEIIAEEEAAHAVEQERAKREQQEKKKPAHMSPARAQVDALIGESFSKSMQQQAGSSVSPTVPLTSTSAHDNNSSSSSSTAEQHQQQRKKRVVVIDMKEILRTSVVKDCLNPVWGSADNDEGEGGREEEEDDDDDSAENVGERSIGAGKSQMLVSNTLNAKKNKKSEPSDSSTSGVKGKRKKGHTESKQMLLSSLLFSQHAYYTSGCARKIGVSGGQFRSTSAFSDFHGHRHSTKEEQQQQHPKKKLNRYKYAFNMVDAKRLYKQLLVEERQLQRQHQRGGGNHGNENNTTPTHPKPAGNNKIIEKIAKKRPESAEKGGEEATEEERQQNREKEHLPSSTSEGEYYNTPLYIEFKVFDEDTFGSDDFLGSVRINTNDLHRRRPGIIGTHWYPLQLNHRLLQQHEQEKNAGGAATDAAAGKTSSHQPKYLGDIRIQIEDVTMEAVAEGMHRQELTNIFKTHSPEHLKDIDFFLKKFKGNEARMIAALAKKFNYQPHKNSPSASVAASEQPQQHDSDNRSHDGERSVASTEASVPSTVATTRMQQKQQQQPPTALTADNLQRNNELINHQQSSSTANTNTSSQPQHNADDNDTAAAAPPPTKTREPPKEHVAFDETTGERTTRSKILWLFRKKCPQNVPKMDSLLEKSKGREAKLLSLLTDKYGPVPDEEEITTVLQKTYHDQIGEVIEQSGVSEKKRKKAYEGIPAMLVSYEGREEKLIRAMRRKYLASSSTTTKES